METISTTETVEEKIQTKTYRNNLNVKYMRTIKYIELKNLNNRKKTGLDKWKTIPHSWKGRVDNVKILILSKWMSIYYEIPIKKTQFEFFSF